jgi:CheY-like chemotaxis protein
LKKPIFKLTVLVIDDNEFIRKLLGDILRSFGWAKSSGSKRGRPFLIWPPCNPM